MSYTTLFNFVLSQCAMINWHPTLFRLESWQTLLWSSPLSGINDQPTLVGQPATNACATQGSQVGNLNQADHLHDMWRLHAYESFNHKGTSEGLVLITLDGSMLEQ